MQLNHAERDGSAPAKEFKPGPTIAAVALYGPSGWRDRNAHLYVSDAALRWAVQQHRAELIKAGAIAYIGGRVVGLLPVFDQKMVEIGKRALGFMVEARQRSLDDSPTTAAHIHQHAVGANE